MVGQDLSQFKVNMFTPMVYLDGLFLVSLLPGCQDDHVLNRVGQAEPVKNQLSGQPYYLDVRMTMS
jgi:hypothetical protein